MSYELLSQSRKLNKRQDGGWWGCALNPTERFLIERSKAIEILNNFHFIVSTGMVYNMKVRDHLLKGRFDVDVLQNAIFIFSDLFQVHIVSHICRFSEPAFTFFMHIVALDIDGTDHFCVSK